MDSNHRSRRRQIYSLMHLATLQSARIYFNPTFFVGQLTCGAGDWNRTHNLLITNQLLCQLSYTSTNPQGWCLGVESNRRHMDFQSTALPTELPRRNAFRRRIKISLATRNGLEPSTSSVTGWRSNQLSYRAVLPYCLYGEVAALRRMVGLHGLEPRTNRL